MWYMMMMMMYAQTIGASQIIILIVRIRSIQDGLQIHFSNPTNTNKTKLCVSTDKEEKIGSVAGVLIGALATSS